MMIAGLLLLKQRPTGIQLIAVPLALVGLTMIIGLALIESLVIYALIIAFLCWAG